MLRDGFRVVCRLALAEDARASRSASERSFGCFSSRLRPNSAQAETTVSLHQLASHNPQLTQTDRMTSQSAASTIVRTGPTRTTAQRPATPPPPPSALSLLPAARLLPPTHLPFIPALLDGLTSVFFSLASSQILVLGVLVFIVSLIALIRHSIARQRLAATSGALLSNSRETVVRYTNRTPRYDPWGFEMKEAVLATVDDRIPSLYEVVLDEKGGSGTDYEVSLHQGSRPRISATIVLTHSSLSILRFVRSACRRLVLRWTASSSPNDLPPLSPPPARPHTSSRSTHRFILVPLTHFYNWPVPQRFFDQRPINIKQ